MGQSLVFCYTKDVIVIFPYKDVKMGAIHKNKKI